MEEEDISYKMDGGDPFSEEGEESFLRSMAMSFRANQPERFKSWIQWQAQLVDNSGRRRKTKIQPLVDEFERQLRSAKKVDEHKLKEFLLKGIDEKEVYMPHPVVDFLKGTMEWNQLDIYYREYRNWPVLGLLLLESVKE